MSIHRQKGIGVSHGAEFLSFKDISIESNKKFYHLQASFAAVICRVKKNGI